MIQLCILSFVFIYSNLTHAMELQLAHQLKSDGRIHNSIAANNIKSFEKLLEQNPCDINKQNKCGETPLTLATTLEKLKFVEILLCYRNLDVNGTDCYGLTPLHIAAMKRDVGITDLLLFHHADPFVKKLDNTILLPIQYLAKENYQSVLDSNPVSLRQDYDKTWTVFFKLLFAMQQHRADELRKPALKDILTKTVDGIVIHWQEKLSAQKPQGDELTYYNSLFQEFKNTAYCWIAAFSTK